MPRVMDIATPLGPDVLLFHSMRASESLGRLFDYQLTLLATRNDIVDKSNTVCKVTAIVSARGNLPQCPADYRLVSNSWNGNEAILSAPSECTANNAQIHTLKRSRVRVSETMAGTENGFRFTNAGQLDT